MLAASVTPASTMRPVVTWVMRTRPPVGASSAAPAAVAVHCAVGARWLPYSSGVRNWRSAEQKWEQVAAQTRSAPPSTSSTPSPSASPIVEHAP